MYGGELWLASRDGPWNSANVRETQIQRDTIPVLSVLSIEVLKGVTFLICLGPLPALLRTRTLVVSSRFAKCHRQTRR